MTKEETLLSEYSKLISNPEKVYRQNPSIIEAAHSAINPRVKIKRQGHKRDYKGKRVCNRCMERKD